jgi:hypothetical protein
MYLALPMSMLLFKAWTIPGKLGGIENKSAPNAARLKPWKYLYKKRVVSEAVRAVEGFRKRKDALVPTRKVVQVRNRVFALLDEEEVGSQDSSDGREHNCRAGNRQGRSPSAASARTHSSRLP